MERSLRAMIALALIATSRGVHDQTGNWLSLQLSPNPRLPQFAFRSFPRSPLIGLAAPQLRGPITVWGRVPWSLYALSLASDGHIFPRAGLRRRARDLRIGVRVVVGKSRTGIEGASECPSSLSRNHSGRDAIPYTLCAPKLSGWEEVVIVHDKRSPPLTSESECS